MSQAQPVAVQGDEQSVGFAPGGDVHMAENAMEPPNNPIHHMAANDIVQGNECTV